MCLMRFAACVIACLEFLACGNGSSSRTCTVTSKSSGAAVITCPDGTTASVEGLPGAPGATSLLRIDDEPPGPNCANGGVAVHSGLDLDGNGMLSDSEIMQTAYVCDASGFAGDTVEGTVFVANTIDVALLAGVVTIVGDLYISGPAGVVLPSLGTITGSLTIGGLADPAGGLTDLIESVALPALSSLGGDLVGIGSSLVNIEVPVLASMGGTFRLGSSGGPVGAPGMVSLSGFGALADVGGDLKLLYLPLLTSLTGLENLATIGGDLIVQVAPGITDLGALGGLASIGNDLRINGNGALVSLGLVSLATIGNVLQITSNPLLPTCEADALLAQLSTPPPGGVGISGNDDAATCP